MPIPDQVTELIATSGNTFHAKVARWLQRNGWATSVSPYYMDQTQNKARELDLVAEKAWPVLDTFGRKSAANVVVRLFIECKFVPSHSVFWFAKKDMKAAESLVYGTSPFRKDNAFTANHHYLAQSPNVAKVFATSNPRGAEAEPFYKALNQVLNGSVAMRSQPLFAPDVVPKTGGRRILLEYPVVVCSSFELLYGLSFFDESTPDQLRDNFQLEVRYAYIDGSGVHRNEYFLLDIVAFENLAVFADAIDVDASTAASLA